MQNHLFSLKESPSIASSASPMSAHDPSQQSHSATSFPTHARPGLTIQDPATMSSYYPSYELGSASPHDGYSHLGESLRAGGGGSGTPSPAQISAMMMHNPKRAYRQRRKDPSCDACRERKVKVGLSGMHERRLVTNSMCFQSVTQQRPLAVPSARVAMSAASSPRTQTVACRRSSESARPLCKPHFLTPADKYRIWKDN